MTIDDLENLRPDQQIMVEELVRRVNFLLKTEGKSERYHEEVYQGQISPYEVVKSLTLDDHIMMDDSSAYGMRVVLLGERNLRVLTRLNDGTVSSFDHEGATDVLEMLRSRMVLDDLAES